MCGIVGVLSKTVSDAQRRAFFQNLYFDTIRGEDSTGVAVIKDVFTDKPAPVISIYKSVGTPSDLLRSHPKGKELTSSMGDIFMGHNRFATQGAVTVENAHPFEFENIIGMHNGTVPKFSLYDFKGYKTMSVDSQIILNELEHAPISEVWERIDGSATLVWFDKRDQSVNFIHNEQRPLWFTPSDDDNAMFWSSEPMFARMGALRSGVKIKDSWEPKINTHFKFAWDKEGKKIVMHHAALSPFVRKPVAYGGGWDKDWSYGQGVNTGYKGNKPNSFKQDVTNAKGLACNNFIIEDILCDDLKKLDGPIECVGVLPDGRNITIYFRDGNTPYGRTAARKQELAGIAKRIMSRSPEDGQYYSAKISKSTVTGRDCFVNWESCHWVPNHNKKKKYVRDEKTGGYKFLSEIEVKKQGGAEEKTDFDYEKDTAPWYEKHQRLSQKAFLEKTKEGCENCRTPLLWEHKDELLWVDKEVCLCQDCKHQPWVEDLFERLMGDKE